MEVWWLVAPCAGAWVEITSLPKDMKPVPGSLPVRERGLKSVGDEHAPVASGSLPVRERGLKYDFLRQSIDVLVGRSLCGSVG